MVQIENRSGQRRSLPVLQLQPRALAPSFQLASTALPRGSVVRQAPPADPPRRIYSTTNSRGECVSGWYPSGPTTPQSSMRTPGMTVRAPNFRVAIT